MVRDTGVEPVRGLAQTCLRRSRLPIPANPAKLLKQCRDTTDDSEYHDGRELLSRRHVVLASDVHRDEPTYG